MQTATDAEELSSYLNPGDAEVEPLGAEADCFPLDGVIDAAGESAPTRSEAIRSRSANLAREVLARAEREVHDLEAQDLHAADWALRSGDIVARAQREVSEILARGRAEAEFFDLRGDEEAAPVAPYFARLRALALPSEERGLRYQVSGQLTLASLLAFQQAVSRLPGVDSARVDPHPDDLVVLSMTTNDDASLVQRLLVSMPGIHLQMEAA